MKTKAFVTTLEGYIEIEPGVWKRVELLNKPFKFEFSGSIPLPEKRVVVAVVVGGLLVRRQLKKRKARR